MAQDNVFTRITVQKAADLDSGSPLSAGQYPKFVVNLSKSIQGVTSEELGEAVTRTETAANKAATSEKNAKTSETNAKNSQTAAATSQTEAKKSQDAAKTSETNAKNSETAAKNSQTAAASSQSVAKTSETNAKISENAAKASQTAAASSQSAAKTSETNAKASETAAKNSQTAAANSQNAAKTSETNAKASEVAAKTSETNTMNALAKYIRIGTGGANKAFDYADGGHGYFEWHEGGTRRAFVGFTANGSTNFAVTNEKTNGTIDIQASKVLANSAPIVTEGQDGFHGGASSDRLNNEQEFLNAARDQKISSRIFRNDQTTIINGVSRYSPSFLFKAGDTWANLTIDFSTGRLTTRAGNTSGGATTPSRRYLFNDEVWTRDEADNRYLKSKGDNSRGVEQWNVGGLYVVGSGRWVRIANITGTANTRYLFRLTDARTYYSGNGVTDSSFIDIAVTVENRSTKARNVDARVYVYSDTANPIVRIEQLSGYNSNIWVWQPVYSSYTASVIASGAYDNTFAEVAGVGGLPLKDANATNPETATYDATQIEVYTDLNSSSIVSRKTTERQSIVSEFEAKYRIDASTADNSFIRLFALDNGKAGIAFKAANGNWQGELYHPKDGQDGTIATREWVRKGDEDISGEFVWNQKAPTTYAQYINSTSDDPASVNYMRRFRNYRSGTLWHEVSEAGGLCYYHGPTPTNFISRLNSGGHLTLRDGLTIQETLTSGGGIHATVKGGSWTSWQTRGAGLQVAATDRNGASSIFKMIDAASSNPIISFGGFSEDGTLSKTYGKLEVGESSLFITPGKFEFNRDIIALKSIYANDVVYSKQLVLSDVESRKLIITTAEDNSNYISFHNKGSIENKDRTAYVGFPDKDNQTFVIRNDKANSQLNIAGDIRFNNIPLLKAGDYGWGGTGKVIYLNQTDFTAWMKNYDQVTQVVRNDAENTIYRYSALAYFKAADTYTAITASYDGEGVRVFGGNGSTMYDYDLWTQRNTTVDGNGFVKKASPIVKLYSDRLELNEESQGVILNKVGTGHYIIEGVLGFNSDGAWGINGGVVVPKDENDQPIMWVKTKVLKGGNIEVRTFHRQHQDSPALFQNYRIKEVVGDEPVYFKDGDVVDIPDNTWIDLRVEMPEDSIYNVTKREQEEAMKEQEAKEKKKGGVR